MAIAPKMIEKVYPEMKPDDAKKVQAFTYKNLEAMKKYYLEPEKESPEQTIARMKEVEQLDPESAFIDAYRAMAQSYEKLRKFDDAATYYQKRVDALEQKGLGESNTMILFLVNLSYPYAEKGDLGKASEIMGKALALAEKLKLDNSLELANYTVGQLADLGILLLQKGKSCESIPHLERAIDYYTKLGKKNVVSEYGLNYALSDAKAYCPKK